MTALTATSSQLLADHYDGPGGWWPIFPIFWLLCFVTAFLIFARFGWWGRRGCYRDAQSYEGSRAGEARLAERFAAGEIDEEEYTMRLSVLKEARRGDDR